MDSISNNHGTRRRECFDEVADIYDRARPAYPDALIRDLIALANLGPKSRVLEIGCGTGQLTVQLAQLGVSLVAVELGANLAKIARLKLSSFGQVTVHVADFDTWSLPTESFDLVVAATSFHWLDPATRVQKCALALRPGGMLGIIDTHWGAGRDPDGFSAQSQACYVRWYPPHSSGSKPRKANDLPEERGDLNASERFEKARLNRYQAERQHSVKQYLDLLRTFSDVRALDEKDRAGFLSCMRTLIDSRFGGGVTREDIYDLWTARKIRGTDVDD